MATDSPPPAQLKDWFDAQRYQSLAKQLQSVAPKFDAKGFLKHTLTNLDNRSLMQRLGETAVAAERFLPGNYRQKVALLKEVAPMIGHEFVAIFLCDFVARYGRGRADGAFSLKALHYFTNYGSAEFAVRPFIQDDLTGTLRIMEGWTRDENEKVRRLASEGCRPRLPWGQKLTALVKDPNPITGILEALKSDPALFVRKSVANNLNDIAKDHPDWVIRRLTAWDRSIPGTAWIAKHAARTLIKKGHPEALHLFGFGAKPRLRADFSVSPSRIQLGDTILLELKLHSTSDTPQHLAIDYVMHYARGNDRSSTKVFKWTELELPAKTDLGIQKRQTIRDFSTRKHYPGRHKVEVQINGIRMAESAFEIV
jgi:3-methyladenine DNA glycosylase AlkC